MKVLFLTPWYPESANPHYGIFIRDQAIALSQHHEVVVVASRVDYGSFGFVSWYSEENQFQKVKEYRLRVKQSIPFYNQLNFLIITALYTRKIARQFRPDVIHGNIGFPGAWWSWVISRMMGVPYVITEHSTWFRGNLRTTFHRHMTLSFMRKASAIISVSVNSATEIFSYIKKQPVIIPNIIVVNQFSNVTPALSTDTCHIGFLGGLDTPRKGLDVLLEAVSGLSQKYVLHIGGKGKLLQDYQSLAQKLGISDKCVFHGFVADGQVPAFMGILNFFVSASRAEGFGMVIAEAMACGLPVIATRSGGPQDFVTEANGRIVAVESVEELREGIAWMIDNHPIFNPLAIRAYVIAQFSPEVISAKIEKVYTAVVRKAS